MTETGATGRSGTGHVVVIGAGPAGLSAAFELSRHGTPVTVLEKDPGYVGGISRTLEFLGCRFDVAPDRSCSRSEAIEALWTEVLGEQINPVARLTRIHYKGKYFAYPLKASNAFLNLGLVETARCLASYAQARMRAVGDPRSFEDRVSNQFGHRLFSILLPPSMRGGEGAIGTPLNSFRYPRLGAGQMWEAVADRLRRSGHPVRIGEEVVAVRHTGGRVIAVAVRDAGGRSVDMLGSQFISTMPVRELIAKLSPAAPAVVRAAAEALGYRDLITVNVVLDRANVFPDQWIYVNDPSVKVGRISNFKNLSPAMVADPGLSGLGMEYFCFQGDGLWAMSDADLLDLGRRELVALGICDPDDVKAGMVYRQPKAYPVYDDFYEDHLALIREWLQRALPNLWLIGRNGMHHYNSQDHSMMTGILVARNIALGADDDPWRVNSDTEYHEEEREGEGSAAAGRQVAQRIAR